VAARKQTAKTPPWSRPAYRTLREARVHDGYVEAFFVDGRGFRLDPERIDALAPPPYRSVELVDGGAALSIDEGRCRLSWFPIRRATDPAFARAVEADLEQPAPRVGAAVRRARERAGVDLATAATSAGVPAGRLEALERGELELAVAAPLARSVAASCSLTLAGLLSAAPR
jgi:hypothetical protein